MTEREIMLRNALLTALAEQAKPRTEAFLHAKVQAALGAQFSVDEVGLALAGLQRRQFATALPNADEVMEWRITSEGRHQLIPQ